MRPQIQNFEVNKLTYCQWEATRFLYFFSHFELLAMVFNLLLDFLVDGQVSGLGLCTPFSH